MKGRAGFALLESLLALAILGTAGLSLVALVRSGLESEHKAREVEEVTASASRVLTAMSLLTRADLDQRLGTHPVGEFAVEVQRPERTLYRIAISSQAAPAVEMLVTVVYKP